MNLMGMSFKDFIWEHNPTALNVTAQRAVRESLLPFCGGEVRDLGGKRRRVTGEGYFTGPAAWAQWEALMAVYRRGGPGSLCLPGQTPFFAVMDGLTLLGAAGKNTVRYAFSFTETAEKAAHTGAGRYNAKAGESLWDYSLRFDRDIDSLIAANPQIADIAALKEGEAVTVP